MSFIKENLIYKEVIKSNLLKNSKEFCPFRKEKQMDYLFDLLSSDFQQKKQKILDVCCGYGRLIYFLNQLDCEQYYFGIDYVDELINKGMDIFADEANVSLESLNFLDLSKNYNKNFDISINYKTMSWLPYYEELVEELVRVTKKKIYITSLFYDGDIDFINKIYINASNNDDFIYLNTYSFPKFEKFCKKNGVKKVDSLKMSLDFDLAATSNLNELSTFTIPTSSHGRLEVTGNVILNWKLIILTL